jgi:hypothetical protein
VGKHEDKERDFRLRPAKSPARGERQVYASAYRIIMHHARMSGVRRRRVIGLGTRRTHTRPYSQRCAVRVLFSKKTSNGQWRSHGRYIARESAAHGGDPKAVGFNATEESIDIAARLEVWQKTNDERPWKLIVSPEFGDRGGSETVDVRSDFTKRDQSRYETRMGSGGSLQYRAPACSCCATRRRSGRSAASSQPGLH